MTTGHSRFRIAVALLAASLSIVPLAGRAHDLTSTYKNVGVATCDPSDQPETALQGQVPWVDRISGRASAGYNCNLVELGRTNSTLSSPVDPQSLGWANADSYGDCYYYGTGGTYFGFTGPLGQRIDDTVGATGTRRTYDTRVIDVSDPLNPRQTAVLTSPAMQSPWESLRVNAKRGLLVAARSNGPWIDVYDVSQDCRHPVLLASKAMPHALGHEGWFSPDGMTYWVSNPGFATWPIDLTDPTDPKEIGDAPFPNSHGGSSSDNGMRGYFCTNIGHEVTIVDTSDVQLRRPDPEARIIATIEVPDDWCQETYPVTYGDHEYLIQWGETPYGAATCPAVVGTAALAPNFARPKFIDISDERHPVVVSVLMNQVAEPQNCALVAADRPQATSAIDALIPFNNFQYGTHMCHPDRLHDPTILACAEFFSGVRVYDIRDPLNPREVAYHNTGGPPVDSQPPGTGDMAASRPIIRPDKGQIWYSTVLGGFRAVDFRAGVYPFPESRTCAPTYDYFFAQYDLSAKCAAP